jgi:RHS repeat-associated protein
VSRRA